MYIIYIYIHIYIYKLLLITLTDDLYRFNALLADTNLLKKPSIEEFLFR